MRIFDTIKRTLNEGDIRSVKAKQNICLMLLMKGSHILIGLLLVPMTLGYVDSKTYGLWIALSSMITWFSFFDLGINHGLKNNLAKVLATGELDKAKVYISTTYAILALIFIPLMLILLGAVPFIDWHSLLSIDHTDHLLASIYVIIGYFCISSILNTINIVSLADQRPADASFRSLVQQAATLVLIFILTKTTQGNLLNLCLGLCVSPVIIVALFNWSSFKRRYDRIAPSLKSINFRQAPALMKLGAQFFIIQAAGIIQFQMINFLIMRYYGANEVTAYNIACKYFNVLLMTWGILITPIWVGVADATASNDYKWIRNILKKYLKLFCMYVGGGLMMLSLSQPVYALWIGDKVEIPQSLSGTVLLYNLVMMFGNIHVYILNGSGQLKVQVIACLISPFVFIGVFYFLRNYLAWGLTSILIAAIMANFNGLLLAPLQCRRLTKRDIT